MNLRLHSIAILSMLPVVLPVCSAGADELSASSSASTFTIHDAASTLRDYCSTSADGRLWFTLPGGPSYELVTSTEDPAIFNPGDGAFHPFDEAEVHAALSAVRFPLGTVGAEVFILPYPRRVQIESAAGRGVILLSPGVRPLSTQHQHAEFVHELGHVVQYALMPDGDPRWSEYRSLRAIGDASRYSATSAHANRPHEIFAEDFRALFGGAAANYSGTIENTSLTPPAQVAGLESFLHELSGGGGGFVFRATPNPTRGRLTLSMEYGVSAPPLDVIDASGRRIATLLPTVNGDRAQWSFEGTDERGRPVTPGVLYARPRGVPGFIARIVVLP